MGAIDFNKINEALRPKPYGPGDPLGRIIGDAVKYIFVFAGLALLLYLIYGGFQLMTSGGDPGKMKEARAIITNAVVGFLIIFVAYWLVQAVGIIFGVQGIIGPQGVFR